MSKSSKSTPTQDPITPVEPSVPSTSQDLSVSTSSQLDFLKNRDIRTPPPANTSFVMTSIDIELDIKITVITSRVENDMGKILAPLLNLHNDYIGEPRYRTLWPALSILASLGLKNVSVEGERGIYRCELCRQGVKLLIESSKEYEISEEIHWAQSFNYLCNGLRTEWTVQGGIFHTSVNYEHRSAYPALIQYLQAMGVKCRSSDKDNYLILTPDQTKVPTTPEPSARTTLEPSAPSTSRDLSDSTLSQLDFRKIRDIRIPPHVYPSFVVTSINVELDIKVTVVADRVESDIRKIFKPLIYLHDIYKGEPRYKTLWCALCIFTSLGLKLESVVGEEGIYRSEICRGTNLLIESSTEYEISEEIHWTLTSIDLCDGIRTKWKVHGSIFPTLVKYKPGLSHPRVIQCLQAMGVKCRSSDQGNNLIFIL